MAELKVKSQSGFVTALIDDDNYEHLKDYKWLLHNGYAYRSSRPKLALHRFILPNVKRVDHKNGDKLDCRRLNLRSCTRSQNAVNCRNNKGSTIFRGLSKKANGYSVTVAKASKNYHLLWHKDPVYLAAIYDEAALYVHGEFVKPNFSQEARETFFDLEAIRVFVQRQIKYFGL